MALVLAAGVCLCISSCEEAGDTSSPKTESDTSSSVPTGRDIIAKSSAKDAWDKYVYQSRTRSIQTYFGSEIMLTAARGIIENDFIRTDTKISEVTELLKELESHIDREITKDEAKKLDDQMLSEMSDSFLFDLAQLTMYDYSPVISEPTVYNGIIHTMPFIIENGKKVKFIITEEYLKIDNADTCTYFKLDGNISELTDKIKSIRER